LEIRSVPRIPGSSNDIALGIQFEPVLVILVNNISRVSTPLRSRLFAIANLTRYHLFDDLMEISIAKDDVTVPVPGAAPGEGGLVAPKEAWKKNAG
jgi:hypothetical protein